MDMLEDEDIYMQIAIRTELAKGSTRMNKLSTRNKYKIVCLFVMAVAQNLA